MDDYRPDRGAVRAKADDTRKSRGAMSDFEALKLAPFSYILGGLFSVGGALVLSASWKVALGLTLLSGTVIWMLAIHDETKKRKQ